MVILALDLATTTGFCIGRAGGPLSRAGSARLKKPGEGRAELGRNLGCLIRDLSVMDWPDLVVIEAALHAGAKNDDKEKGGGFSVEVAWLLVGAVYGLCGPQGIPVKEANVQTIRKHFTGKARWGGRDAAKKAVVDRCHLLGLMPRHRRDDNEADAIATHDWACATFARSAYRPSNLVMFGERR